MNVELLTSLAGGVLSLVFSYAPNVSTWFESLTPTQKRLVMLLLLTLVALGVMGAACWTPYQYTECSEAGAWQLLEVWIGAVIANQATFLIAPKKDDLLRAFGRGDEKRPQPPNGGRYRFA